MPKIKCPQHILFFFCEMTHLLYSQEGLLIPYVMVNIESKIPLGNEFGPGIAPSQARCEDVTQIGSG